MENKKATKKVDNSAKRENDKTYRAYLDIGGVRVATITMAAEDDDDAKQQLERARPSYYEGVGEWTLAKDTQAEIKL